MPPKQATARARGRPKGAGAKGKQAASAPPESSNPFASSDDQAGEAMPEPRVDGGGEPEKSIPRDLLTRILHDMFARDATRISRDANAAVAKYVDVFVREAIARAAVDKRGGFLEVRGSRGKKKTKPSPPLLVTPRSGR